MSEAETPQRGKSPPQLDLPRPLSRDAPLENKLRHLGRALEISASLHATALRKPLDPPLLRDDVTVALNAVISFLDSENLKSRTLRILRMALDDLGQGHVGRLLTPSRPPRRRMDTASIQGLRATAAAAMEILFVGGMNKDEAAQWVAEKLAQAAFKKSGNQPITHKTVSGWRDRYIRAVDEADAAATDAFRYMIAWAHAQEPTPEKQAQFLIDRISAYSQVAAGV